MNLLLDGQYHGTILSPRWLKVAQLVWRGKIFEGDTVINRIGPFRLIRGKLRQKVEWGPNVYYIRYPGGLTDIIKVMPTGAILGSLSLLFWCVRFRLQKEK